MQNLSAKYGKTLNLDKLTSYCPGCGHGIVTRLVAEAIETLGIRERAIAIVGIGCGGFSHHYMDVDAIEATHGRSLRSRWATPAVPTTSCSPTAATETPAPSALAT
ncbi:MAG: hypothetical protein ACLUPV_06780 [Bilophila wadsworthia]